MTADTIETRVARGAALLDDKLPGWHKRIDLDRLDLGSPCNRVLGQEFEDVGQEFEGIGNGPFAAGIDEVLGSDCLYADAVAPYGFDTFSEEYDEQNMVYAILTAEWRRVILARRGGAS